MRVKMHLGILILFLTFLGVANQQQSMVVNQELVLHFTDVETSSHEAQSTISIVKNRLESLGVDNIQVKNKDQGKLIITYYSNVDVENIKRILSEEANLKLKYPLQDQRHSSDDENANYNFDIYEIQNNNHLDSGFDGCVLADNSENDRYFDPTTFFTSTGLNVRSEDNKLKVTYKIWRTIEMSLDCPLYTFPEVRAGPISIGNS